MPQPVAVLVHFRDPSGEPIEGLVSMVGESSGEDDLKLRLEPGTYTVTAKAAKYEPFEASLQVRQSEGLEQTYKLSPLPGSLRVKVTGPDGSPVDALIKVNNKDHQSEGGLLVLEHGVGSFPVTVEAKGYLTRKLKGHVQAAEETLLEVVLEQELITVHRERIDLRDSVYFETAKAVIKSESFTLLDQVVTVMKDYPEIKRLRIEGHTDSRGKADYNLELSTDRAAAVVTYLEQAGIDPARLSSEGFGESKPLDKAETAAAWEKNRRVDFFIDEWDDAAGSDQ